MGARRRAAVVGGSIAVVAVVGWLAVRGADPRTIETQDGAVLVAGSTRSGMDAAIEGTLAFTETGCLGIAGPGQPTAQTVVVLPAGSEVVADDPLVVRINGSRHAVGDPISVGGGEVTPPDELVPARPARCLTEPVFLISRV